MPVFDFISHEKFPQDQYIKEAVCICLDGKYRITYIRKKMQNGGMFWDVIGASVMQNGQKKYLKSFSQDSNFLTEDIKHFLDSRAWENKNQSQTKTFDENDNELPF